MLSVGLFANGKYGDGLNGVKGTVAGLFYGNAGQLYAQVIGVLANIVYVGTLAGISFWLLGKVVKMRPSAEEEVTGLDVPEMGVYGYNSEGGTRSIQ